MRRKGRVEIAHLVVTNMTTCSDANGRQQSRSLGTLPHPLPVSANGSFHYRSTAVVLDGRLLGSRAHGIWRLSALKVPAVAGEPMTRCSTPPTRWSAGPHRRLPVQGGKWTGTSADGQPVSFEVSAGGRIFGEFAVARKRP